MERILRKPTDMKLLSATLRPDRMKRINRADVLTEPPPAPASLSPTAAAAFERLGTLAVAAKTLTALDVELLALAASTLSSCQSLETQLSAEGLLVESRGAVKTHPALSALTQNRALLLRLLDSLGLSPQGRERLPAAVVTERPNRFALFEKDTY